MVLQAHSQYLQVHFQTSLAVPSRWEDLDCYFFFTDATENWMKMMRTLGKFCHAPSSPMHGAPSHKYM